MKIFIRCFFWLMMLNLLGCMDGPYKCKTPESINKEVTQFCAFQPGSWWVYRHSSTQHLDTWHLFKIKTATTISNYVASCYDIRIETIITDSDTFSCQMDHNLVEFNKETPSVNYHQTVFASGQEAYKLQYLKLIRSDSVSGECVLKEIKSRVSSYFPTQYTWERHIGITMMIYEHNDTLQLINHQVMQ